MSKVDATSIFLAGIEAVKPEHFIPKYIKVEKKNISIAGYKIDTTSIHHIIVVAVGKAAASMAQETEKIIGDFIKEGIVITKYQHALPLRICKTLESGHPVPDENSIEAGKSVIEIFKKTSAKDHIILLISGGASALMADCPPGCTLEDIQFTVQALLNCGAAIDEINTIRKHLSLIKGGKLMQYTAATVTALVISDAPGDDLSVIASGLTVPDDTRFEDAWSIVQHYRLMDTLPESIINWLRQGLENKIQGAPGKGFQSFERVFNKIVATNNIAIRAAAQKASLLGYETHVLSPSMSGEASIQAKYFTEQLRKLSPGKPACLLWGGETTVTIKGFGKGGRNQEFALAALCHLQKYPMLPHTQVAILAGGTDGTDGPTDAAGAVADNELLMVLKQNNLKADEFLLNNDAYTFFKQTGNLITTGPTQTNVMDIVIGLIYTESISEN